MRHSAGVDGTSWSKQSASTASSMMDDAAPSRSAVKRWKSATSHLGKRDNAAADPTPPPRPPRLATIATSVMSLLGSTAGSLTMQSLQGVLGSWGCLRRDAAGDDILPDPPKAPTPLSRQQSPAGLYLSFSTATIAATPPSTDRVLLPDPMGYHTGAVAGNTMIVVGAVAFASCTGFVIALYRSRTRSDEAPTTLLACVVEAAFDDELPVPIVVASTDDKPSAGQPRRGDPHVFLRRVVSAAVHCHGVDLVFLVGVALLPATIASCVTSLAYGAATYAHALLLILPTAVFFVVLPIAIGSFLYYVWAAEYVLAPEVARPDRRVDGLLVCAKYIIGLWTKPRGEWTHKRRSSTAASSGAKPERQPGLATLPSQLLFKSFDIDSWIPDFVATFGTLFEPLHQGRAWFAAIDIAGAALCTTLGVALETLNCSSNVVGILYALSLVIKLAVNVALRPYAAPFDLHVVALGDAIAATAVVLQLSLDASVNGPAFVAIDVLLTSLLVAICARSALESQRVAVRLRRRWRTSCCASRQCVATGAGDAAGWMAVGARPHC